MLDMIYISPKEKLSITFSIKVMRFTELFDSTNKNTHEAVQRAYELYSPLIRQYGDTIELPEVFS